MNKSNKPTIGNSRGKVALSAYYCNPYLPSEAYGAFRWLQILLEKYEVILISSPRSEEGIRKYYGDNLPENLEFLTFNDTNWVRSLAEKMKMQVHFGYFIFNRNLKAYLKKGSRKLDGVEMILHKNPTSFRYSNCFHLIDKPVVIGPIGGGLQVPKVLKRYFKREPFINKLRVLDPYILKLPHVRKSFTHARYLLITLDYLRDILPEYYSEKLRTFFDTGIDVDVPFQTRPAAGPVKLLFVGNLLRFKGAELGIRAVAQLKDPAGVEFHLAGDGFERPHLEKISKELGIQNQIFFHGRVPYETIGELYQSAHVFLYPSLTEASGNALLEAMKYSLPIVAVNNGGAKYMCPNEGTCKVEINSPDQMIDEIANYLEKLVSDPVLRENMGKANYEHVREYYSWDMLRAKIFDLVDRTIAGEAYAGENEPN